MDDVDKQKAIQNTLQKIIEGFGEERFWEVYASSIDPLKDGLFIMVEEFGSEEQKHRATDIRWDKLTEYMEAIDKDMEARDKEKE
tara:strand:+ start:141 stop:395 length:255 start_codon:yes stop_codon:yes gene_type:complete